MRPFALVAALSSTLAGSAGCVDYSLQVALDDGGAATFRLEIEDESFDDTTLAVMERALDAPFVRLDACAVRAAARGRRVALAGVIADVRRAPELSLFRGARVFLEPLSATETLVQIDHGPLQAEMSGQIAIALTLPRPPLRAGGTPMGESTIGVRAPLLALARRELRLWAIVAR